MKVEIDTLKCVKLLNSKGIETKKAEAIVETLTDAELRNLYDKEEVNTVLGTTVEQIFERVDRDMDQRDKRMEMLERQNREKLERMDKRAASDLAEARNSRRWQTGIIVSTMVVIGVGIAGLIHYIH